MGKKERREELKKTILNRAGCLFKEQGIKAVTMDEISRSLKISKRTLYEIYDNKRDLLVDVLAKFDEECRNHLRAFSKENDNTMDTLFEFFRVRADFIASTNPLFFSDMKKYPDLLEWQHQSRSTLNKDAEVFFRKGIEEGYFLSSVDYSLLSGICRNSLLSLRCDPKYENVDLNEVFHSFICVIIRGFCTNEGIAKLDEFLKNSEGELINNTGETNR